MSGVVEITSAGAAKKASIEPLAQGFMASLKRIRLRGIHADVSFSSAPGFGREDAFRRRLMSCINDVRLVGKLTADPDFLETSGKRPYARLSVLTERYVKVNGESKRIANVHTVVCFNQFALPALRQFARKDSWVKVLGELSYLDGQAQVTVSQYMGEVGLMMIADHAAPAEATDTPSPSKGTGGLGRLPKTKSQGRKPPVPTDALDDEIPF